MLLFETLFRKIKSMEEKEIVMVDVIMTGMGFTATDVFATIHNYIRRCGCEKMCKEQLGTLL